MGDDGPPRIDERDRQVGLEHLRALRAELRPSRPAGDEQAEPQEGTSGGHPQREATKDAAVDLERQLSTTDSTLTVDRMNAEMSAAAEREHLERRVATLEAEVAHLRQALAAILRTAASAVTGPDGETARAMTSGQDDRVVDGDDQDL